MLAVLKVVISSIARLLSVLIAPDLVLRPFGIGTGRLSVMASPAPRASRPNPVKVALARRDLLTHMGDAGMAGRSWVPNRQDGTPSTRFTLAKR